MRRGRVVRQPRLGESERDGERDEPLLCPVVEIALEAAPGVVCGGDEP